MLTLTHWFATCAGTGISGDSALGLLGPSPSLRLQLTL